MDTHYSHYVLDSRFSVVWALQKETRTCFLCFREECTIIHVKVHQTIRFWFAMDGLVFFRFLPLKSTKIKKT